MFKVLCKIKIFVFIDIDISRFYILFTKMIIVMNLFRDAAEYEANFSVF